MIKKVFYLFFLTLGSFAYAQEILLTSKLAELERKDSIAFSFDPELIRGVKIPQTVVTLDQLIEAINKGALAMENVDENSFIIAPRTTRLTFELPEGGPTEFHIDVVTGNNKVLYQNFLINVKRFSFEWTPSKDTIKVISSAHEPIYYLPQELLFNLTPTLPLREKTTYLGEVIIQDYLTSGINLNISNHSTSIKVEEMAFTPGETDGDILAALATLPGVNTPDARPGNISIHNSSSDQNLILFNNIPIYHRGHYFGSISPYNPALVDEVTIFKNGFHPKLGGRVGGVIKISSSDNLDDLGKYGLGVNSLYANGYLNHKLSEKLGISVAARHSLPSRWESPKLNEISDVVYAGTVLTNPNQGGTLDKVKVNFEDYNMNLLWQPTANNKVMLSGMYTSNLTTYQVDTSSVSTSENIAFDNMGLSLRWNRKFNKSWSGELISVYSDYSTAFDSNGLNKSGNDRVSKEIANNGILDASVAYQLSYESQSGNHLSFGFDSKWTDVDFEYESENERDNRRQSSGTKKDVITHSFNSNYHYRNGQRFDFQVGLRGSYYSGQDNFFFSPRILVNYDLSDDLILKASGGRYYQFLSQVKYLQFGNGGFYNELWRLADDDELSTVAANQWMVGGVWTKGKFVLDTEFYRKEINNVNYSNTLFIQNNTEFDAADWSILGVDIFSKFQLSDRFLLWNSYEFSNGSLAFDSLSSVEYQYKYIRPHQVKVGGLYAANRWKISFFYRVASGMYARSVDVVTSIDQFDLTPPGPSMGRRSLTIRDIPERYPTYKTFDFYIVYEIPRKTPKKADVRFGLSLLNLFNSRNVIDAVVRGESDRFLLNRTGMGFAPNLDISISW